MRISDWSSDVCSSDLQALHRRGDRSRLSIQCRGKGVQVVDQGPQVALAATHGLVQLAGDGPDLAQAAAVEQGRGRGQDFFGLRVAAGSLHRDHRPGRSAVRRVGKECGRTGRSRWWPYPSKNKKAY